MLPNFEIELRHYSRRQKWCVRQYHPPHPIHLKPQHYIALHPHRVGYKNKATIAAKYIIFYSIGAKHNNVV